MNYNPTSMYDNSHRVNFCIDEFLPPIIESYSWRAPLNIIFCSLTREMNETSIIKHQFHLRLASCVGEFSAQIIGTKQNMA